MKILDDSPAAVSSMRVTTLIVTTARGRGLFEQFENVSSFALRRKNVKVFVEIAKRLMMERIIYFDSFDSSTQ